MKELNYYVSIYKEQLKKGDIHEAYAGVVKYVMRLGETNILKSPDWTKLSLMQRLPDFTKKSFFFSVVDLNNDTIIFNSFEVTTPKYDFM